MFCADKVVWLKMIKYAIQFTHLSAYPATPVRAPMRLIKNLKQK